MDLQLSVCLPSQRCWSAMHSSTEATGSCWVLRQLALWLPCMVFFRELGRSDSRKECGRRSLCAAGSPQDRLAPCILGRTLDARVLRENEPIAHPGLGQDVLWLCRVGFDFLP